MMQQHEQQPQQSAMDPQQQHQHYRQHTEVKHNFLQRVGCKSEEGLRDSEELVEELRLWASYRGQTLTRTVRGMMYYRKALELQAFLDMANDKVLMEGYKALDLNTEENSQSERSLCQDVADMKFTYVVSCQQYGIDKRSGNPRAQDILKLMTTYPPLRVAYVDELEDPSKDGSRKTNNLLSYYSVLVKAALPKSSNLNEQGQTLDQVIYKIKLPGQPIFCSCQGNSSCDRGRDCIFDV